MQTALPVEVQNSLDEMTTDELITVGQTGVREFLNTVVEFAITGDDIYVEVASLINQVVKGIHDTLYQRGEKVEARFLFDALNAASPVELATAEEYAEAYPA
jgi:hypothetical protein